jgi:hypothetical protein
LPRSKSDILFSSYTLTNAFEYRSFHTAEYPKVSVQLRLDEPGSGGTFTIRGYYAERDKIQLPFSLCSGTLTTSGQQTVLTSGLSEAICSLDVGLIATQSGQGGKVTAIAIGRAR